jgi:hypothetical protein
VVTHNSVSGIHNYVNKLPVYGILIAENIRSLFFLSSPHIILKLEDNHIALYYFPS